MPTIEMIRSTVSSLGKKYGADRITLFGSYARGDMTEDSDIDLLMNDHSHAVHGSYGSGILRQS